MRPFISPLRCPNCEIRRPLCFCELIPRIETKTRVFILMHTSEEVLTSNTAKLASKALVNSEIRIHGRRHERMSSEGLTEPDRVSLLLFPSSRATVLTREWVDRLPAPVNLIVPDASWRQTTKFVRHDPSLQGVHHVQIAPGPTSQYLLRRQSSDQNLCTLEAIARALGVFESADVQIKLETLLRVLVERTLWSRGQIKASQCVTAGIPQNALSGH
jgi:DTW domain-containing protein YfiP